MKNIIRLLAAGSIGLSTLNAQSFNVVGYYNYVFSAGGTFFASQLDSSPNDLNTLFTGSLPSGTTISLWNSTTRTFTPASAFTGGSWSFNLTLQAGTGYLLNTAISFTNTFVGTVLNHDGSLFTETLTPPPVYAGANGIYLLADKTPLVDTGTDIFLNILGRLPNIGEQVITLTGTSSYLGGGSWSGGVPTLNVGDAALLNVGPVPEPATLALAGLGGLAALVFARRQK